MFRHLSILFVLLFASACGQESEDSVPGIPETIDLARENAIAGILIDQRPFYPTAALTVETFDSLLTGLGDHPYFAIPIVSDYLSVALAPDNPDAEKIFFRCHNFVDSIHDFLIPILEDRYAYLLPELLNERSSSSFRMLTYHLRKMGIRLASGEGDVWLESSAEFLEDMFNNIVSNEIIHYLQMVSINEKRPYVEDASLLIPLAELRERIGTCEDYLREYPNSPFQVQATCLLHNYVRALMGTLDNTPLEDWNTGLISWEFREIYESILREEEPSRLQWAIKDFYSNIMIENFNIGEDEKHLREDILNLYSCNR